ncbi:hypothetical protein N8B89_05420 [Enterococcus faecium]
MIIIFLLIILYFYFLDVTGRLCPWNMNKGNQLLDLKKKIGSNIQWKLNLKYGLE